MNHNKIGRRSALITSTSGKTIYYNHKSSIGAPVVRNEVLETSPVFFTSHRVQKEANVILSFERCKENEGRLLLL